MNEQPPTPEQPQAEVQPVPAAPVLAPQQPTVNAAPAGLSPRKGMAIAALILSIASVIAGIVWFIAAPLAIVALILGIIALAKKLGGRGMSIASVIIGGVSLVILIPIWMIITLVMYQGITQQAQEAQDRATQSIQRQ